MKFFINNLSIQCLIKWFIQFGIFFFMNNRADSRFLTFSPPFLSEQLIFDRKNKKIINVHVREHKDWSTCAQIFYDNDYGFEKLGGRVQDLENIYQQLISNNLKPLIIDCGGNIGLSTRFFFETYPDAKIICIEPEHCNFLQAKKNNIKGDITFIEAAIGSSDSRGNLIDIGAGNNGFRIEDDNNGNVEILSINTILKNISDKSTRNFILKIDIEGFEKDLFSKNIDWIDEFPILVIELHDWMFPKGANSGSFLQEISKYDRDFLYYGENIFSISNKAIQEWTTVEK